jgi:hypothetical protein
MAPNAEVPHQLAAEDLFDENSGELRRSALDVACDIVRKQDGLGKNTFIAVGALVNAKIWDRKDQRFRVKREGGNIRALRAYTMDIDAGPRKKGTPYETTEAALVALKSFCKAYNLPKPTLVQSGFGLHVWWTLTEEVPEAMWEHYGRALYSMSVSHGLRCDKGRTVDSSSILRIAGGHNHKYEHKPVVEVLAWGEDTATDVFHGLLTHEAPPISAGGIAGPGTSGRVRREQHEPLRARCAQWQEARAELRGLRARCPPRQSSEGP